MVTEEGAASKSMTTKKTRTRSPNYPALNLADAVERAEMVFSELGRSRVGDEEVARALGYNKLHGKSRTVVSALKKYGFLEPDGDGFRISDDALDIVTLDSDDPDRARAMYDAALKPVLFAELHETYGDNPPGDSLLRNYLLKKNFNHNIADEVIRVYRDTMDIVSRKIEEYTGADEPDERQEKKMQQPPQQKGNISNAPPGGAGAFVPEIEGPVVKRQHYGLSEGGDVYLLFVGEHPSKEDIEMLKEYLDIFARRLHSEDSARGTNEVPPESRATNENGQPD